MKTKHLHILFFLTLLLAGCREDIVMNSPAIDNGEIKQGEEVLFTTWMPDVASNTRATKGEWKAQVDSFKPVNRAYTFKVEMYKQGTDAPAAYSYYKPIPTETGKTNDGTLSHYPGSDVDETSTPLYWQDNVSQWGFKATTVSSEEVEADQSTQEKWLRQDKLMGYSYLPIWDETEDKATDDFDNINYRTNKQWYADNKKAKDDTGLMVEEGSTGEEYKKVPLYMKHQRAWVTVILKAGEGVKREALNYATSKNNIQLSINSFKPGETTALEINKAWSSEHFIDYEKDKNGEAQTHVSTTRYDAIVEPHNYATKKDGEVIARINLSNQNFSFYASNDIRYLTGSEEDKQAANNAYNLEAGKHLTIEVTLSRESRKILITAWIQDWTEVATQTICDDYGQNGDPVVIKNRTDLLNFLRGEDNKQGSVGILQPTELSLDVPGEEWPQDLSLNATLNLAGCVLKTGHRLFKDMSTSANLVNGSVQITEDAELECAIADKNEGTIERVNVTTTGELTTAKATLAGLVKLNHGTIYQCASTLPVYGTVGVSSSDSDTKKYIGGIAAISVSSSTTSMAVIDGCSVNASVDGKNVSGGGIAGYATGRISNNRYEYGITFGQNFTNFKNIFAQAGEADTRAYGNAWPTNVKNYISESDQTTNPNTYQGTRYDAVLDCQAELDKILREGNSEGKLYRISKSFTVESSTEDTKDWKHGVVNAEDRTPGVNNVSFTLEGNDKTITLTGTKSVTTTKGKNLLDGEVTTYTTAPMLFNYVLGEIRNLTIYLDKPLVASPSEGTNGGENKYTAEDAIAPLAYGVYGDKGKLTNVKVKAMIDTENEANNAYVQASTPAGLVVWAHGGAQITNCSVRVPVRMWLPSEMGKDAKHYAGGIVACAARATITQCSYLGNTEDAVSGSLYSTSAKQSANYFYGGIVGGTSQKEETPELEIKDCASWFIAKRPGAEDVDQSAKGGIIGYCNYAENNSLSSIKNGMKDGNEGNWWQLSANGAHTWLDGLTEEKVIGKRNSITPAYKENF